MTPRTGPRVLAIVGPTASGKSALAMRLAPELGAEIVSVDSATVYRGMDVGTAKPGPADLAAVPHHMLDIVDPGATPTVAEFQRLARQCIDGILERGRVPLLVGGSGLYFRAVVDPMVFPGTDPQVRRRLEREAQQVGGEQMYRRLQESDPAAASRIHPANLRRTVRALEVAEIEGRPFSSFYTGFADRASIYDLKVAGLAPPWDELDARIGARVDTLVAAGWLHEVEQLAARGLSATSVKVLGYAQLLEHLHGLRSLEDAVEEIKLRTRQFARRQRRWHAPDPRIRWFAGPDAAAQYLTSEESTGDD